MRALRARVRRQLLVAVEEVFSTLRSRSQSWELREVRELVDERLSAAVERIFGAFERGRVLPLRPGRRSGAADPGAGTPPAADLAALPPELQQLSVCKEELPPEQQERGPGLGQEEPGPPHIKEEEEEFPVKTEHDEECAQWSQLHQRQTEEEREAEAVASTSTQQMETQADGEDWGVSEAASSSDPAAALQPAGAEQLFSSHASQTDTEDSDGGWEETRRPPSGLSTLGPETHGAEGQRFSIKNEFTRSVEGSFDLRPPADALSSSQCKVCQKSFSSRSYLTRHARVHSEDCFLCGKHCESTESLKYHLEDHRTCSVCGRICSSIIKLEGHMRVHHTKEKPFRCTVCEKGFSSNDSLSKHIITHIEERPFTCALCGKGFRSKFHLNTHMRCHTGEKPFSCSICGKKCNERGNLKKHMRRHTGEKPFSCSVCGKCFRWHSYVKTHHCAGESSSS